MSDLPKYIEPVSEGESRTCFSERIWKPIVRLAKALKNLRGQNCDVYLSDGKFVLDLINSTRRGDITDGGGGGPGDPDGGGEEWPWPPFPPRYPPPPGWNPGQHMIAGFYVAKYKAGIRSPLYYEDTENDNGERYLKWNIALSNYYAYPVNDVQVLMTEAGPWSYDGSAAVFNFPNQWWVLPTFQYALTSVYGENPFSGSCVCTVNRYGLSSSLCTPTLLSFRDEIDMQGAPNTLGNVTPVPTNGTEFTTQIATPSPTSFVDSRGGYSCSGSITQRYKSEQMYDDAATLMNTAAFSSNFLLTCEFEQPTGATNGSVAAVTSNFSQFPPPPAQTTLPQSVDTPEIRFGSYSSENQNIVATNTIGGKTLNVQSGGTQVLAYHFARKAKGGGTWRNPTGKFLNVELQRCQFGSKPGPTTWYMHTFTVPAGTSIVNYPQQRLPSNAVYSGTTSVVSTGTHTDVPPPQAFGYIMCNRTATPPAPPTPEVDTGQSRQPVVSKIGADISYNWNHGEPYLQFEVYRNTTNNSATATLIATVLDQEPTPNSIDTMTGFIQGFGFNYLDTGPFTPGTTYYYWHKAYFDSSRKSGFSIVKSIVY